MRLLRAALLATWGIRHPTARANQAPDATSSLTTCGAAAVDGRSVMRNRLSSQPRRNGSPSDHGPTLPLPRWLWGQVAELPSYLDRATRDAGNVDEALLARIACGLEDGESSPCALGDFACMYPEDTEDPRRVAVASAFEADVVLPKERWMLDTVRAELAEGRRVMILGWHERVLPRLARLVEQEFGERVALLDAKKVAAAKRQGWIDREVIAKGFSGALGLTHFAATT